MVQGQSDTPRVVIVATLDDDGHVEQAQRYVVASIGHALQAHAPDPEPGAVFWVEYVGQAQAVNAESDTTPEGHRDA